MPLLYVGMNSFTSFKLIADLGNGKNDKFYCFTAFFSSLVLIVLIHFISSAINFNRLYHFEMPMLVMTDGNCFKRNAMLIICFVAIFSTLICSLYSSFSLCENNHKTLKKSLLSFYGFLILDFQKWLKACIQ